MRELQIRTSPVLFGYPHFAGDQSRSRLVIHTLHESNQDLVWLSTLFGSISNKTVFAKLQILNNGY